MNSLNIVSRLTTPPATPPPRSRTSSSHQLHTLGSTVHDDSEEAGSLLNISSLAERLGFGGGEAGNKEAEEHVRSGEFEEDDDANSDEKKPLLGADARDGKVEVESQKTGVWQLPGRTARAMLYGVQVVFSTVTAPIRYVIACFYDEQGRFSAILPIKSLGRLFKQRRQISTAHAVGLSSASPGVDEKYPHQPQRKASKRRSPSVSSTASTLSAASSSDVGDRDDSPARHTRSRASTSASSPPASDETGGGAPRARVRYKEETLRRRRGTKTRKPSADDVATVASALKSPSSPSSSSLKLTRYPRHPAPPRPLVPRRQPSYSLLAAPLSSGSNPPRKTLIIDLDETLIHSMAKGGRMSTGHMVEVRMSVPVPTPVLSSAPSPLSPGSAAPATALPPGLPILYYVHERPGCHDFLRKVCKWFRLVVFTASVQEYADPVIDWLERERKYFSGRYYRQHCTLRNGAYIKDLAQVEPDLSRVMILDNSPMSYIFHEDNAIPIEGWISDPTDNDLLHLIPLLEGLQYVTDVRALLALRQGQAQQT